MKSTVLVKCTEDTDAPNARELHRVVRKSNMLAEIVCAVIFLVIASGFSQAVSELNSDRLFRMELLTCPWMECALARW